MTTNFPEVLPHSAIEEVFPNLFMVRGSFQMAPLVTITRNMFILRNSDGELTLINSVRLSDVGEAALGKLGEVKHLIRIGAFHDRDDPYFVHRYKPTFWALPGTRHSLDITAGPRWSETNREQAGPPWPSKTPATATLPANSSSAAGAAWAALKA